VNITEESPFDDNGTGMDVCLDPTLLANCEMLFVMSDRALYITFDQADNSPLNTSVGPMTDTFFDLIGRASPIFGGDAGSGPPSASALLNIAIFPPHKSPN
jgi:hypothetical protein